MKMVKLTAFLVFFNLVLLLSLLRPDCGQATHLRGSHGGTLDIPFGEMTSRIALYNCSAVEDADAAPRRSVAQGVTLGRVFFDYIGANGVEIYFSDLPIDASSDWTFVLGLSFAVDADTFGAPQNGNFRVNWNPTLSASAAQSWRSQHGNSRIVIALCGYEVYDSTGTSHRLAWYDPVDSEAWLQTAVSSLTAIVNDYKADGIDIDYENFPNGSSKFIDLVGRLIKTLKDAGVISIVSIAPGYDQLELYSSLYDSYGQYIDVINYQFYGEGLDTVQKYKDRYYYLVANWLPQSKLGLSEQVTGSNSISGDDFYQLVQEIREAEGIAAIYIWNADLSKVKDNFGTERAVAAFL